MTDTIKNNENWGSIRTKLNEIIAAVNSIETASIPATFEQFETDSTGEKLTKGSLMIFRSATDNKYYKIDVEVFYNTVSKGL